MRCVGATLVGFRIGTDAVVVVVHPSNDFLTDATLEELRQIFTANNWFDVNPRWPRRPVQRFIPANGSTARTFFGDVVNLSAAELDGAGNTVANADLRVLAEALSNNPLSIGFLNYATLRQYIDQLQMIKLAGVAPSYENVETGRYPLAQPLIIYTDADLLRRKPQVAAYITFALQKATATSQESGYFPPSAAVLRVSATALLQALTP
ncbi:MAG: substrate-binding domain-containing protein [Chloroflexales bacterium]